MMKHENYQMWWALHLRVAKGGILQEDEQQTYEAGKRRLH